MLHYPQMNPIAFSLGPLKVHWYGIMYLIGFAAVWLLGLWRARQPGSSWTAEQVADVVFYGALGLIIGGRVGYMVFYAFPVLLHHPLTLFKIWDGGMSFHGGLVGGMLALWFFAWRRGKRFGEVTDFVVPFVPIGLGAGRIGNFINGGLWGRVTDVPWGMVYPQAGPLPRHPSEIYEFLLEGVLLFTILWIYSRRRRPCYAVSALFLLAYGCFRFFVEFFRQPDPQLGFVAFGWMTMGQLLSVPMIIIGAGLWIWAYRHDTVVGERAEG